MPALLRVTTLACTLSFTALLTLTPLPAAAHAVLTGSSLGDPPRTAAGQPTAVTLRFNSHLELDYVTAELSDTAGHTRTLPVRGGSRPGTVELTLPPLEPGVYAIDYHVVARDGHLTDGRLEFTVTP